MTKTVVRRVAPNQGMQVSLADIMIAYIVVFNRPMPRDLAFVTAGEQIRVEAGPNWQALMRNCMDMRSKMGSRATYEAIAAAVKAAS